MGYRGGCCKPTRAEIGRGGQIIGLPFGEPGIGPMSECINVMKRALFPHHNVMTVLIQSGSTVGLCLLFLLNA